MKIPAGIMFKDKDMYKEDPRIYWKLDKYNYIWYCKGVGEDFNTQKFSIAEPDESDKEKFYWSFLPPEFEQ